MLVLSRKSNEQILVGDFIKITVLGIQGNQVRLGFEAPNDVAILRAELVPSLRAGKGRQVEQRASVQRKSKSGEWCYSPPEPMSG